VIVGYTGRLACLGAICLALLSPARANAQGESGSTLASARPAEPAPEARAFAVALDYTAAAGCPDGAALETIVIDRLGYDPFAADAKDHVALRITARGSWLDGHIEWRDSTGKWTGDQTFRMVSTECLRLTRTMGLALAVQIQLLADMRTPADKRSAPKEQVARPPERAAATPIEKPPAATSNPTAATSATNATTTTTTTTTTSATSATNATNATNAPVFSIGAGPSVGFGMAPKPVLLGRIFGVLSWHNVSAELATEASLPATTRRADGAGFAQHLLLVSAAGCAALTDFHACLVINAGEANMVGKDIDRPTSARVAVVEAGLRVGVRRGVGRLVFLGAHVDGLVNLNRWTASLDEIPVWTAPRLAATLGVEAGLRLP